MLCRCKHVAFMDTASSTCTMDRLVERARQLYTRKLRSMCENASDSKRSTQIKKFKIECIQFHSASVNFTEINAVSLSRRRLAMHFNSIRTTNIEIEES